MVGKGLQAVLRETGPATVRSAFPAAIDAVGAMSARAGALLEGAEADVLTYLDFPAEHRRCIRTNNLQGRMNREIKRRSLVIQVFPSAESMLCLVGAVCAEQDEDWSSRRGLMIVETAMELADDGRGA